MIYWNSRGREKLFEKSFSLPRSPSHFKNFQKAGKEIKRTVKNKAYLSCKVPFLKVFEKMGGLGGRKTFFKKFSFPPKKS